MARKRVVIAGAGGMGSAVAGLLLRELGDFEVDLFLGDSDRERAELAAAWVREGSTQPGEVRSFHMPVDATRRRAWRRPWTAPTCCSTACRARKRRAWRSWPANTICPPLCQPGRSMCAKPMRSSRSRLESDMGFVLQTWASLRASSTCWPTGLFQRFCRENGVDKADVVRHARGGGAQHHRPAAAPTTASPGARSAWPRSTSSRSATVVREGKRTHPAGNRCPTVETILIHGVVYEEALTSGGAAPMPAAGPGRPGPAGSTTRPCAIPATMPGCNRSSTKRRPAPTARRIPSAAAWSTKYPLSTTTW